MNNVVEKEDVLVVGAGVIGLTLAYELLRRGRQVTVLDREAVGAGAARHGGGMLSPITTEGEDDALVTFGVESLRRYPALIEELERETDLRTGYRTEGTLWVATNDDEDAALDRLAATHEKHGITSRRLTSEETTETEPFVTASCKSGLFVDSEHSVDPRKLAAGLARAVVNKGGRVVSGYNVEEIARAGGSWTVRGKLGQGQPFTITCQHPVLAAGAWSTETIASPATAFEVRPIKGQALRLRGPEQIRHNIRTSKIYLVPRHDGELILGATLEDAGFDETPTAGLVMDLIRFAWQALPSVYNLEIGEATAGLRPALIDNMPVVDSPEPGFFVTVGHYRAGVLLAPATAHHLADWITSGTAPSELDPFRAERLHLKAKQDS